MKINDTQREMLESARTVYMAAGGELDELWQPFLMRFLVAHDWNMAKVSKQLQVCVPACCV